MGYWTRPTRPTTSLVSRASRFPSFTAKFVGFGAPNDPSMASSPSPPSKRRKKIENNEVDAISPLVVFAHGAGAPSTSEWMVRWKKMLGEELGAVGVITFDYPYMSGGKRRAPPKAEKLVEHHSGVVKDAVSRYPGHPLVLVGKSMGSRVSCMVAAEDGIDISAIICLGYPLKGINGAVRDETLLKLDTPIMFVQGSKDSLCPLDKLEITRKKMKSVNELHVIDGGDHSFKIGKKLLQSSGSTQAEAEGGAARAVASFISKVVKGE